MLLLRYRRAASVSTTCGMSSKCSVVKSVFARECGIVFFLFFFAHSLSVKCRLCLSLPV
jgi:hypothetical protein